VALILLIAPSQSFVARRARQQRGHISGWCHCENRDLHPGIYKPCMLFYER
jgi:hypothetical protein